MQREFLQPTCKFLTRGVYNRSVDITLPTVTTEAWFVREAANNFLAGRQALGIEGEAAIFFFPENPQRLLCETACEMKLKQIT